MSRRATEPDDDLPRDARLQAALRHAEEGPVRPAPAVRAQVLAAARAALPHVAPPPARGRRWLQALLQPIGAPRVQAGLATLAVAGLAVGLWAGRDLPSPMPSSPAQAQARAPTAVPPSPAPSVSRGLPAPAVADTASTSPRRPSEMAITRPGPPARAPAAELMTAPAPAPAQADSGPPPQAVARAEPPAPAMAPPLGQAQAEGAALDSAAAPPAAPAQRAKAAESVQAATMTLARREAPRPEPPALRQALGQPGWQIRREPGTDLEPLSDALRERLHTWLQAPGLQPEGDASAANLVAGGLQLQGPQGERVGLQRLDDQTLRLLWQGQRWILRAPGAAEAMGLGGP